MLLQDRITATKGRSSGFDYLRLILALVIAVNHEVLILGGEAAQNALWSTWARPALQALMPMFFALSGFLVSGSLERTRTLVSFLGLRMIRILPALVVEVTLSALLIGPLVSSMAFGDYVGNPDFRRYFLNILGRVHFRLPGVFDTNPLPHVVNGQLWTLPWEFECYFALALLAVFGLRRARWVCLIGIVLALGRAVLVNWMARGADYSFLPASMPGELLLVSFLVGVALYLYREKVPATWPMLAVMVVISAGSLAINLSPDWGWIGYLAPLSLAYVTIFLGLLDPRRILFTKAADYSYGIFLYHFVIGQLIKHLWPELTGFLPNLAIMLIGVTLFSAASWHLIELPTQGLRKPLKSIEQWVMARSWGPLAFLLGTGEPLRRKKEAVLGGAQDFAS